VALFFGLPGPFQRAPKFQRRGLFLVTFSFLPQESSLWLSPPLRKFSCYAIMLSTVPSGPFPETPIPLFQIPSLDEALDFPGSLFFPPKVPTPPLTGGSLCSFCFLNKSFPRPILPLMMIPAAGIRTLTYFSTSHPPIFAPQRRPTVCPHRALPLSALPAFVPNPALSLHCVLRPTQTCLLPFPLNLQSPWRAAVVLVKAVSLGSSFLNLSPNHRITPSSLLVAPHWCRAHLHTFPLS